MTSRIPVTGKASWRAPRTPPRGSARAAAQPVNGRRRDQPDPRFGSCQGTVTAEFAVALPAVMLLLALLLAGSAAGVTQLRFEEAARAGARALARGEGAAAVDGIVRRLAGESAVSAVADDGGWLSVTVSGRVPGSVGSLVPWTLTARAWARGESSPAASVAPAPGTQEHQSIGRRA